MNQGRHAGASLNVDKYKKTVLSALWVHITLVACNLPYAVVTTVKTIHGNTPSIFIVEAFAATLVFLNSSLNPVLYCWKIKEVRKAVKQTTANFRCLWMHKNNILCFLRVKTPTNSCFRYKHNYCHVVESVVKARDLFRVILKVGTHQGTGCVDIKRRHVAATVFLM